jgi:TetR/AcrR family transcriptional regulator, transcriptional repressor for nem operon
MPVTPKQRIIEAALDRFHAQGIIATSVDEILLAAGAGKGQFYHYFDSKDDLIHEVLGFFYGRLRAGQLPGPIEIESWSDLERWFASFLEFQRRTNCERSCPVATIGADLQWGQELARQDVRLIFEFTRHCLSRFFTGLKARGELPQGADAEALASLCFSVQQGGMMLAKIERECAPFQTAVTALLQLIQTAAASAPR